MAQRGILAIWNSCATGYEDTYETWYQHEHLIERLSISGFRLGRRYQSLDNSNHFFTYYETNTADVLTSSAYLERVDNPTPMTEHVMCNAFKSVSRTVCEQQFVMGTYRGAFAATLVLDTLPSTEILQQCLGAYASSSQIARIEGWQASDNTTHVSNEARLRGTDDQIRCCLFVETLRLTDNLNIINTLADALPISPSHTGNYRLLCELSTDELNASANRG